MSRVTMGSARVIAFFALIAVTSAWKMEEPSTPFQHQLRKLLPGSVEDVPPLAKDGDFHFLPILRGKVPLGESIHFSAHCFRENEMNWAELTPEGGVLRINVGKARTYTCMDYYLFSIPKNVKFTYTFVRGEHKVDFKWDSGDYEYIKTRGIAVFEVEKGVAENVKGLYGLYKMFNGSAREETSLEFLKDYGFEFERRTDSNVMIPEKDVRSGDVFLVAHFNGLEPLIMLGTNGIVGHCVTALWIDGELYIIESMDADPMDPGGDFPPPYGLSRRKYSDWMDLAVSHGLNVMYAPLDDERRALFDEDKAVAYFVNEVEGLPYGFQNFIYLWLDHASKSFPPPATEELLETIISMMSQQQPEIAQLWFGDALNKRLGTEGLNFDECLAEAHKRGTTFGELGSIPEQDDWRYPPAEANPTGQNLACSSSVVSILKEAGAFGEHVIQAAEQSPVDLMRMQIYKKDWDRPAGCNPNHEYCQIIGEFKIKLHESGYNSIPIYSGMNESCGRTEREPGC